MLLGKEFESLKLFDTHSHYNDEAFNEDREEIIKKIYEAGIENTVVVGDNIENSKKAIELANTHDFIYAAVRNTSERNSRNRKRNR